MVKNPITKDGFEKLQEQINFLKNIERQKIINDIKNAREHGDLKENAEYHAAKEAQFLLEKKIKELELKIITSQIIEINEKEIKDKVVFGTTVKIINIESKEEFTYQIVGEDEADIKKNKLSIKSPLARELIQKTEGDIIKLILEKGIIKYKIIKIT